MPLAGDVAIKTDTGSIICLDHSPPIDADHLDVSEISLPLPADLPWDSEHGALCALYDSIDLPFE